MDLSRRQIRAPVWIRQTPEGHDSSITSVASRTACDYPYVAMPHCCGTLTCMSLCLSVQTVLYCTPSRRESSSAEMPFFYWVRW